MYVFVFLPQSSAHNTSWQVFAYLHMDQHVIMYGCREYVQYNVEYNCTQSYIWTPIYILLLRWALRNTDTRLPLLYIPHFMFQSCELKYFAFQKQVLVQNYESGLCAVNCLCWLWIATCDVDIKVGIFWNSYICPMEAICALFRPMGHLSPVLAPIAGLRVRYRQ